MKCEYTSTDDVRIDDASVLVRGDVAIVTVRFRTQSGAPPDIYTDNGVLQLADPYSDDPVDEEGATIRVVPENDFDRQWLKGKVLVPGPNGNSTTDIIVYLVPRSSEFQPPTST